METLLDLIKYAKIGITENPALGIPLAIILIVFLSLPVALPIAVIYDSRRRRNRPKQKSRARQKSNWGVTLFFGVFGFVMLSLSAMIFYDVATYYDSKRWPLMEGTVTKSWAKCPSLCYRLKHCPSCHVFVWYAYGSYTGQAEVYHDTLLPVNRNDAQDMLQKFAQGMPVMVRYNPSIPGRSRLEDAGTMQWFPGFLFLAFSSILFSMAFLSSKKLNELKQNKPPVANPAAPIGPE